MFSFYRQFARWLRTPEAELFRRELAWLRRWFRSRAGIAWIALLAACAIAEEVLRLYFGNVLGRSRGWRPVSVPFYEFWGFCHLAAYSIPFLPPLLLLRRRVFGTFKNGASSALAVSPLTQFDLWPALLVAPCGVGAALCLERFVIHYAGLGLQSWIPPVTNAANDIGEWILIDPTSEHWPHRMAIWIGIGSIHLAASIMAVWLGPLLLSAVVAPRADGRRAAVGACALVAAAFGNFILDRLLDLQWIWQSAFGSRALTFGEQLDVISYAAAIAAVPITILLLLLFRNGDSARRWALPGLIVLVLSLALAIFPGLILAAYTRSITGEEPDLTSSWIIAYSALALAKPLFTTAWNLSIIGACMAWLRSPGFWRRLVELAATEG